MKILSIETSCDDTCISILEMSARGGKVLANNSNSQIQVHIPFGGVYPVLAKREHAKNLPVVLDASLMQAKLHKKVPTSKGVGIPTASVGEKSPVDAIAVTYGPGLEMCLWEGITFAKDLAKKWNVPIIPVNHMEGHVLSVFGKDKGKFKVPKIATPVLSLLVSGGHTQLVLVKKDKTYEIIGETVDDAVGEAFDKVARMLDLPYPGGPQISKLAEEKRKRAAQKNLLPISLPRPMLHSKNFNFSFSGLKTAVLYLVRDLDGIEKIDDKIKAQIALEFENAAIECLVYKTKKAIEKYGAKTLIVAGGVAANQHLKNEVKKAVGKKVKILFPPKGLAGDNSLMIGIAGYLTIKATGNLKLR